MRERVLETWERFGPGVLLEHVARSLALRDLQTKEDAEKCRYSKDSVKKYKVIIRIEEDK